MHFDFINCRVTLSDASLTTLPKTTTSADNVALPAFGHRTPLLLNAGRRPCSNRWIFPPRRAHSSKPAAAGLLPWDRQTDRQTDGHRKAT